MKLHKLKSKVKKKKKRVGRGYGSGKGGHTSTRGMKGQKSRSGFKPPSKNFEGGQTPLSRRLPKLRGISQASRGSQRRFFKSKGKELIINVKQLDNLEDGVVVTPEFLIEKGYLDSKSKKVSIKILGFGDIKKKIIVKGIKVSSSAKEKIEKAGGKVGK